MNTLLFRILALTVMVFFYGIYFTKMYLQKRRGIKTSQIGKRKEKGIHTVEIFMSFATVGVVLAQLLSLVFDWNYSSNFVRYIGFFVGIIGDAVFLVSTATMKDSWRAGIPDTDKTELVTNGIYRFSRNPAFLGFDLMYLGLFLLFLNPLTAVFTVFSIVMLHLQILSEEKYLLKVFGQDYIEYKDRVFRYIGRR